MRGDTIQYKQESRLGRMRYSEKLLTLRTFLILFFMINLLVTNSCLAMSEDVVTEVRLQLPIQRFSKDELGGIRLILPVWDAADSDSVGLDIHFFFLSSQSPRDKFYEEIPVFDNNNIVHPKIESGADCSFSQGIILLKQSNKLRSIYFRSAERLEIQDNKLLQFYKPAIQRVRTYILVQNIDERNDRPRYWFNKISTTFTSRPLCTDEDVRRSIVNIPLN